MHARSAGSGATREAPTVLPMARSAGSAASPITSKLSAIAGTGQGVPQLAKARQARRRGGSHSAKRPNKQIQSYCEKGSLREKTRSLQHQPIWKMLRMGHETRSFQDHLFKQSILPRTNSLAMKLLAGSMEVVQPRIRCPRIQTLKAGWPYSPMCL